MTDYEVYKGIRSACNVYVILGIDTGLIKYIMFLHHSYSYYTIMTSKLYIISIFIMSY